MSGNTQVLKNGFLDVAAALFVIGGVISLIVSLLTLPIFSIYPFIVVTFAFVLAVVFMVGLVCSLVAIHCYTLAMKRLLSQAGMRGIICGAILLTLNLGLVGTIRELISQLGTLGAIMILVAGTICFVLRQPTVPGSQSEANPRVAR